jgi:hypothetical protein
MFIIENWLDFFGMCEYFSRVLRESVDALTRELSETQTEMGFVRCCVRPREGVARDDDPLGGGVQAERGRSDQAGRGD